MTLMTSIRKLRWHFKPFRYLNGFKHKLILPEAPSLDSLQQVEVEPFTQNSFLKLPFLDLSYPENDPNNYTFLDKPFTDLYPFYKKDVLDMVVKILDQDEMVQALATYFEGRPKLWNLQFNYSRPREGMTDSQFWHFNYGDKKQMHIMHYVSDVDMKSGPFTYLKRQSSDKVKRSPLWIERMTDKDLKTRFDIRPDSFNKLTGKKGETYVVDPGKLMHQGARCETDRIVLFISFTRAKPYETARKHTLSDAARQEIWKHYETHSTKNVFKEKTFCH